MNEIEQKIAFWKRLKEKATQYGTDIHRIVEKELLKLNYKYVETEPPEKGTLTEEHLREIIKEAFTYYIWLLTRDTEYEEIQAMVIIAKSEEEARILAKNNNTIDNNLVDWYSEEVICLRLGISDTPTSEIVYIDFKSA